MLWCTEVLTCALLDSGSSMTFCEPVFVERRGVYCMCETSDCTNDKPPQRGGAVPFPALERVEMACRFPEGLILGRFSLG